MNSLNTSPELLRPARHHRLAFQSNNSLFHDVAFINKWINIHIKFFQNQLFSQRALAADIFIKNCAPNKRLECFWRLPAFKKFRQYNAATFVRLQRDALPVNFNSVFWWKIEIYSFCFTYHRIRILRLVVSGDCRNFILIIGFVA